MYRRLPATAALFFILLFSVYAQDIQDGDLAAAREALAIELFQGEERYVSRVREAFLSIDREDYISGDYRSIAYRDMPVPSRGGLIQPAPTMIASILLEAQIGPVSKVLVIGRNTSYLNDIVHQLTGSLYVIDPTPGNQASPTYSYKSDLSYFGWVEEAPFSCIILFGAVEEIPQSLVSQLADNGRIIAPVEAGTGNQMLMRIVKYSSGFSLKSIGESYIHKLRQ